MIWLKHVEFTLLQD